MKLDFFLKASTFVLPNKIHQQKNVQTVKESLSFAMKHKLFCTFVISLLDLHKLWYKKEEQTEEQTEETLSTLSSLKPLQAAYVLAQMVVHKCYDLTCGKLNYNLLYDSKQHFKKCFNVSLKDSFDSFTTIDGLYVLSYLELIQKQPDFPMPRSIMYTDVFKSNEYNLDQAVSCFLGLCTLVGQMLKLHYDSSMDTIVDNLHKMKPKLEFVEKGNKYQNYVTCLAWVIVSLGQITNNLDTRNNLIRTVSKSRDLFLDIDMLRAFEIVSKPMKELVLAYISTLIRFFNAILQLHTLDGLAAIRAVAGLDKFAYVSCGYPGSMYLVKYSYPMTVLDHDVTVSPFSLNVSQGSLLLCVSLNYIWTALTNKKTWCNRLSEMLVSMPFEKKCWYITEDELSVIIKERKSIVKKIELEEINTILKELQ